MLPGLDAIDLTTTAELCWGGDATTGLHYWVSGVIDGATRDAGSTPTTILRPGLVMGRLDAGGKFTNYDPAAQDGSEVAVAILGTELRAQDFNASDTDRVFRVLVKGLVKASSLHGLDDQARVQLSPRFTFDDDLVTSQRFLGMPWKHEELTASRALVAADAGKRLVLTSADCTITMPPIHTSQGFAIEVLRASDHELKIRSYEGANMIFGNQLQGTSITWTEDGEQIGVRVRVEHIHVGNKQKWLTTYFEPVKGTETTTITFAVDPNLPEPPPASTALWEWTAGDFSKATYDAFVADPPFDTEANGRLTAPDNNQDLALTTAPQKMNFPINYEAPSCDADGKLRAFSESDATNDHSMWRADNTSAFDSQWYLPPNTRYRFEADFDVLDTSDWASLSWAIPFQLHPGNFPPGHNQQAPVNFYLYPQSNRFQLQLLGNDRDPATGTWNHTNTFDITPFSTGRHTVIMEWVTDPAGDDSEMIFTFDGAEEVNTTVPHGLLWSAHNNATAHLTLTMGLYSSGDQPAAFPEILWREANLYSIP
jgi:hypothetical protein